METCHPKTMVAMILAVVLVMHTHAQIINPGFETYTALPTQPGQVVLAEGWFPSGGMNSSPDYYHYLSPATSDIPETPVAFVYPATGQALCGLTISGRPGTNIREYLSAKFSSPLVEGRSYDLYFKVTNGSLTEFSTAGVVVNHLGVFFSDNLPTTSAMNPLMLLPQLVVDTIVYAKEWQELHFRFIAPANARYMTIGLFGPDAMHTMEIRDNADALYAYYFFDDFMLEETQSITNPGNDDHAGRAPQTPHYSVDVQPAAAVFIPNSFSPNNDGNNDVFRPVAGSVSDWTFWVFDRWGSPVFKTTDESLGWDGTCRGGSADAGAYMWQIEYKVFDDIKGWQKITEHGTVTLLR
jgi:gliding motility-associated-like protein